MKTRLLLGFLGLFFILTVSGAQAALIYNNGLPDGQNGNEMTAWIQAEDFTFTASQTVTAVRFWALDLAGGAAYQGSVVWQIYNDNSGQPGALLASGSAAPPAVVYQSTAYGPDYQFDFSIGSQALLAGTYWLGLHNGPLTTQNRAQLYWETTGFNGTFTGHEDIAPFTGAWFDNGQEHAFQLFNQVPIPGAFWLLGSGLLGLAGLRRKFNL